MEWISKLSSTSKLTLSIASRWRGVITNHVLSSSIANNPTRVKLLFNLKPLLELLSSVSFASLALSSFLERIELRWFEAGSQTSRTHTESTFLDLVSSPSNLVPTSSWSLPTCTNSNTVNSEWTPNECSNLPLSSNSETRSRKSRRSKRGSRRFLLYSNWITWRLLVMSLSEGTLFWGELLLSSRMMDKKLNFPMVQLSRTNSFLVKLFILPLSLVSFFNHWLVIVSL